MNKQTLRTTLALSLLVAGPIATAGVAQETPSSPERRVMIWRTESDEAIDIEAIGSHRGFLGVGLLGLTPELREHFGVPHDRGVMISKVLPDSPAERAGLQPADILTAVDGEPLPEPIDLSMKLARAEEGAEVEIERWRGGRRDLLPVPLETRPRSQMDLSPLIVHRVNIKPGHKLKIATEGVVTEGSTQVDQHWVEEVVETVGDSFSEASFIQQLEALRRERNALLEHLRRMEVRLEQLESELHLLDSQRR